MDPLTASTTLATLVGLICNFKQERGANASGSRQEFFAYLEHHRHEQLRDFITNTYHLSSEVDALLREDHAVILEKLNSINALLGTVISKIDGFQGIVHALAPESELSQQAFDILCALYDSTSNSMSELKMHGYVLLCLHNGGQLRADDQRFLKDDLDTLCALNLLSRDCSSGGDAIYNLTRAAEKFISEKRAKQSAPDV